MIFPDALITIAQKEGYHGVFDWSRHISFHTDPPTVTHELPSTFFPFGGTATVSDREGNLLFFTDGGGVFNRNGIMMPHGDLYNNFYNYPSRRMQILIVPVPKDPFLYYIFETGHPYHGRDFHYSLVDIRLNNGLGDVVYANKVLFTGTTEKQTTIKHATDSALWLVTHEFGTNRFRSYKITEDGIDPNYVISAVGRIHAVTPSEVNAKGHMRASPDGSKIAVAVMDGTLELFDFDRATGVVHSPMVLLMDQVRSYSVEFSSDGSKLYNSYFDPDSDPSIDVRGDNRLFQYDLSSGDEQLIRSSKQLITYRALGPLQRGPNDKIYFAVNDPITRSHLSCIHKPNLLGALCEYERLSIPLVPVGSIFGLPEFDIRIIRPEIFFENPCKDQETTFDLVNSKNAVSVSWNFGDPDSGTANFSDNIKPKHTFTRAGVYKVTVQATYEDNSSFSFSKSVSIYESPMVNLGKDTTICTGTVIKLKALNRGEYVSYQWQDGTNDSIQIVDAPGKYWVKVVDYVCATSDTITIKYIDKPSFDLENVTLCYDETLNVVIKGTHTSYLWNDGFNLPSRTLSQPGPYSLYAENKCGNHQENFEISVIPKLQLDLGKDTTICKNVEIKLNVKNPVADYLWQDNSETPEFLIQDDGLYWVEVFNSCESLRDSIVVKYHKPEDYFFPNVLTINDDGLNELFVVDPVLVGSPLKIFDRWGKIIYASDNYRNDWPDPNAQVSPGVYYYSIRDQCLVDGYKGLIQIIR